MHAYSHSIVTIEHRDIAVRVVGAEPRMNPYADRRAAESRQPLYRPEELRFILSRRDGMRWTVSELCLIGKLTTNVLRITEHFRSLCDLPDEYRAIVKRYLNEQD